MPTFAYTARALERRAQVRHDGRRRPATTSSRICGSQRLIVVKIDEEAKKKKKGGRIKMRDIVIFTRQFSTMINSGLPLVQALDILSKQSENKALAGRHARRSCSTSSRGHTRGRRAAQASQGVHGAVREHGRRR